MEAIILDAIAGVLPGVHLHMVLRCVEHVCHPNTLQVVDIADCVSVTNDNSFIDFVTVDSHRSSLVVIGGGFESWHRPVLPSSCVDY